MRNKRSATDPTEDLVSRDIMAKLLATLKAIITRLVFAAHGFIAIWQVTNFKKNPLYWYLSCPILLLFFEGIFTLTIKANQEWKWFCPSVFLYLSSVVPAIWLLELDKVDRKLRMRESNMNLTDNLNLTNLGGAELKNLEKALGVNIRLPDIQISTETWVTLIEQFLMLILIIGRWMLPKGELTRDQLSQLLLVYIGTAADIIEFFDSFKENKIAQEPVLVYLTLAIWAWSLMQFTVVLTATKSRKSRLSSGTATARRRQETHPSETSCCSIDVWGIALNMALQDGPFLAFRLILIIHYRIVSYMNIFFTCKNTLVILLQLYRLYVVQSEGKMKRKRRNVEKGEMTCVSVISKNYGSAPAKKRKYDGDDGCGKKRRTKKVGRNGNRRVDDDGESGEERASDSEEFARDPSDTYESSPRRSSVPKSGSRSREGVKRARQDTGYWTSSSRNSSRRDKVRRREDKKDSAAAGTSTSGKRAYHSSDEPRTSVEKQQPRTGVRKGKPPNSANNVVTGRAEGRIRGESREGKSHVSTRRTSVVVLSGGRGDKRVRRDVSTPSRNKDAKFDEDTCGEEKKDAEVAETADARDESATQEEEDVAAVYYGSSFSLSGVDGGGHSAESDSEDTKRGRRRKRRDVRD